MTLGAEVQRGGCVKPRGRTATTPTGRTPARGGLRVLCARLCAVSARWCVPGVLGSPLVSYLAVLISVISCTRNDLVRARSARRDRQLGAHLDAQAAARQPALHWGPARFLFSTMYSTAEEEQQGEPPTPPAYRRPPAQRRWMYLNAHERAPASMKRRRVGLARASR